MKSIAKITLLLSVLVSGQALAEDDFRHEIIGGQEAQLGQWPSTVALVNVNSLSLFRRQFCGGSLIGETWVLTAAHCLFDTKAVKLPITSFKVATGVTDLDNEESATEIAVKAVVIHPFYDAEDVDGDSAHDLALIQLAEPSTAPVVRFYSGEPQSEVGRTVTVVGWGASTFETGRQSAFPTVLNQLSIPLISREVCNLPQSYDGLLMEGQICAGFAAGGADSCVGDSGGPLMILQNGLQRQIGVVSFGRGCAEPNQFGVYSSVPYYATWIYQYTSGNLLPGQTVPVTSLPDSETPDGREIALVPDKDDDMHLGSLDLYLLLALLVFAGIYRSGLVARSGSENNDEQEWLHTSRVRANLRD